ncbi:hypothetical protein PNEG_00492 [Pneumocystis murina B123]|uniref:Uncharacterized protein n=1 Tax=Pneumocystis murina (strain B123) TaxID=1069680 RepID=M7NVZ0_PNEMU|nr:hypothetical protein PNEG_00492 [Pneumocystis murina B123]EMR11477.1 hypothetical protein PNEG_00492 [Pneumocystis murina B123]
MTKKRKSSKESKIVPQQELYARISFLYQAANVYTSHSILNQNTYVDKDIQSKLALSRFYINTAKKIARKAVLKINSSIKRTLCRRCDTILLPAITSSIRIENLSKNNKEEADTMIITCNFCNTQKRYPTLKDNYRFN